MRIFRILLSLLPLIFISCKLVDENTTKGPLDGAWRGSGALSTPSKSDIRCNYVSYFISHSASRLEIGKRTLHCIGINKVFAPVTFTLRDKQILLNNQIVGEINKGLFEINFSTGAGKTTYISLHREGDRLYAAERHTEGNETFASSAELTLSAEIHLKQAVQ